MGSEGRCVERDGHFIYRTYKELRRERRWTSAREASQRIEEYLHQRYRFTQSRDCLGKPQTRVGELSQQCPGLIPRLADRWNMTPGGVRGYLYHVVYGSPQAVVAFKDHNQPKIRRKLRDILREFDLLGDEELVQKIRRADPGLRIQSKQL